MCRVRGEDLLQCRPCGEAFVILGVFFFGCDSSLATRALLSDLDPANAAAKRPKEPTGRTLIR